MRRQDVPNVDLSKDQQTVIKETLSNLLAGHTVKVGASRYFLTTDKRDTLSIGCVIDFPEQGDISGSTSKITLAEFIQQLRY